VQAIAELRRIRLQYRLERNSGDDVLLIAAYIHTEDQRVLCVVPVATGVRRNTWGFGAAAS
jgi:hypothetical protein